MSEPVVHDTVAGCLTLLPRVALLALVAALSACMESHVPDDGRYVMAGTSIQDSLRVLLDPDRQLYLYRNRVCRELGKLPSPWRQYSSKRYEKPGPWGKYPPGYDWGPRSDVDGTEVTLEAEYSQLGVPPANTLPGRIRRFGLSQDVALLSLGPSLDVRPHWMHLTILDALSSAQPDWNAQQPIPFTDLRGKPQVFVPIQAPFPVSDRFGVYTDAPAYVRDRSDFLIINPAQRAGVYCRRDYDVPNRSCIGLILLGDKEIATTSVNYEALGTLDEVVDSMTRAALSIRVNCRGEGVTP